MLKKIKAFFFDWRVYVAFGLGAGLNVYGLTIWETMLTVGLIGAVAEVVIRIKRKKSCLF